MKIASFEWDAGNWPKCGRHGVSRESIEHMFESARLAPDVRHSQREPRYIAVGRSLQGRPMFVAFALRLRGGVLVIRPISARYMHAREASRYEESSSI
ncbi:BrnT family toxin [Achromobacter denitrificans]|uniref:BrnT family toxin n=1 Tax=Achromobacter denitrificans TaxID=32002 RepID=UPI00242D3735|nr:BrnT family toxin [Achromobacter denitrificans]MBV2156852.1 BrnT family toxin [Achromobacter denitrificans]